MDEWHDLHIMHTFYAHCEKNAQKQNGVMHASYNTFSQDVSWGRKQAAIILYRHHCSAFIQYVSKYHAHIFPEFFA
jgi:hypothetical protein